MFSGQKKARHDCSGRKADQQQDYEKHLSVRTALISKLTSSSSRGVLTSTIRTSSSTSRSPMCNSPLRIRRSTGRSKSSGSCARRHNSIVSCSTSPRIVLPWRSRAFLSVPGTYDVHVSFDVGVWSNPCLISDQNAGTLTTNEQPQTMHISELLEQTKDSRDVVGVRRSQVVGSHAN